MDDTSLNQETKIAFDLSKITHVEWVEFNEAISPGPGVTYRSITEAWCLIFARTVTACGWGDPANPDTWRNIPHFAGFEAMIAWFWEAVEDERKKVKTKSTTA